MLKKLLRARLGKDARAADRRERASERGDLRTCDDLRVGDLVTFKHRLSLPDDVQGQTFEVSAIGTYQYADGLYPQLTLDGAEAGRIYLSFKAGDAGHGGGITLSRSVPRGDVRALFAEDAFAALWEDDFAELAVARKLDAYAGWLGERYAQTGKWVEGYFFDRDCRGEALSDHADDDSEELRCHECEDAGGRFGLSVEIWQDGDTEVSLDVNCPPDAIDALWPGER